MWWRKFRLNLKGSWWQWKSLSKITLSKMEINMPLMWNNWNRSGAVGKIQLLCLFVEDCSYCNDKFKISINSVYQQSTIIIRCYLLNIVQFRRTLNSQNISEYATDPSIYMLASIAACSLAYYWNIFGNSTSKSVIWMSKYCPAKICWHEDLCQVVRTGERRRLISRGRPWNQHWSEQLLYQLYTSLLHHNHQSG